MRGIEGNIAVRVALRPTVGNGGPNIQNGPTIDMRGFRSAIFQFMFEIANREAEEIWVDVLSVSESDSPNMSGSTLVWQCGEDKTIRGNVSTLPRYEDPDFPSTEGQQGRILVIEDLHLRKRYMRAAIVCDQTGGSGQTDYLGLCYLLDPLESRTTDEQIAGTNGQAVYIGRPLG